MFIRDARISDLEAMSRVAIASITDLCFADHGGLQRNIERWTANKTPEALTHWIENRANRMFIAEENGEVLCVGAFSGAEIQLNYVAPAARFRGISKAMLAHMEARMREQGVDRASLTTTGTAHDFYRSAGWSDDGAPQEMFGFATAQPMSKSLT